MAKKTTTKKNPLLGAEEETSKPEVTVAKAVVAPAKQNADNELLSDIKLAKKNLDAEPTTMFMIPLSEGEKAGTVHDVFINGYIYSVPKGRMVTIPMSVANILSNHYKVTLEAGQDSRIDQDDDKVEAFA